MGSDVWDFYGIVHAKIVLINHYSSEIIGYKQNTSSNNSTVIVEFHSRPWQGCGHVTYFKVGNVFPYALDRKYANLQQKISSDMTKIFFVVNWYT